MNTKTRFLVLDRTNTAISPKSAGLVLADVQSQDSPSILSEETAIKFAQLLAQRNVGQNYYVVKTIVVATAADDLDKRLAGEAESAAAKARPVTLTPTA